MCPLCITTAAMVAAGTTSAGVLGLMAVKFRAPYVKNEINEE